MQPVRVGTEGYGKLRKSSFRVGQTHKVVRKGTERYGLQASGDRLKAASCKFQAAQATGWKLQATGCRLQAAGYRLQATSCRLQAASYRPQATGPLQATAYKLQANKQQATSYRLQIQCAACIWELSARTHSIIFWKKLVGVPFSRTAHNETFLGAGMIQVFTHPLQPSLCNCGRSVGN